MHVNGFFPLTTSEMSDIRSKLNRAVSSREYATWEDVGRLLATIAWYQNREASIATRLVNSETELDVLFSEEAIERLGDDEDGL